MSFYIITTNYTNYTKLRVKYVVVYATHNVIFVNNTAKYFVRTVLILIFAPVFGGFLIVPLWN